MDYELIETVEIDLEGFIQAGNESDLIERSFTLGGEEIGNDEQSP